ncbi:endothelial zinc finger protein induced by tumor necrosis factor alpha-like [Mya arenaria]|uniref:endothelial zinc finger protein induced by tumor necrosis factor alpha-like n=1 Tax=Mya arenaria TaxID=6604 RepID=UPI0022E16068|nr:endothelial zinc finger protein induced by tumor necrosis factor alpha-like [Mya arenaria]
MQNYSNEVSELLKVCSLLKAKKLEVAVIITCPDSEESIFVGTDLGRAFLETRSDVASEFHVYCQIVNAREVPNVDIDEIHQTHNDINSDVPKCNFFGVIENHTERNVNVAVCSNSEEFDAEKEIVEMDTADANSAVQYLKEDGDLKAMQNNDYKADGTVYKEEHSFKGNSISDTSLNIVENSDTNRGHKRTIRRNVIVSDTTLKYAFSDDKGNEVTGTFIDMVRISRKHGKTLHSCNLCKASMDDKAVTETHLQKHLVIKCLNCPIQFTNYKKLVLHLREHIRRPYMCDICYKNFWDKQEKEWHETLHSDKLLCSVCSAEFDDLLKYKSHIRNSHLPRKHKCQFCPCSFSQTKNLRFHEKWSHSEKQFRCDKCECKFYTNYQLKKHTEKKHVDTRGTWACEVCQKVFNDKRYLSNHMRIHTDPQICEVCGKAFNCRGQLKQHLDTVHVDDPPFKCEICEQAFHLSSRLKRHMRTIHGPEDLRKEFTCSFCGKVFKTSGSLKSHVNVHTCGKVFKCERCDKSFLRHSSWYIHNRAVHFENFEEGKIKSSCRYCKEKFKNSNRLFQHIKQNHYEQDLAHPQPYMQMCSICSKVFLKEHYKTHINMHNGIKPHKCLICDKGFTDRSNLRGHLKGVHKNGEFPCIVCALVFTNGYDFKKHVDEHTDVVTV